VETPLPAIKAFAVWLLILVCAVANGALREFVLLPFFSQVAAFVLSGLVLCLCILAVSFLLVPWFGSLSAKSYLTIGLFWLCLTLAFEFGLGRLVQHKTWSQILEAYSFQGGNLWPLVLVVTTAAPLMAARLRGTVRAGSR
jgi:hypothetical protein